MSVASFFPVDVPEYNRYDDEDSLLVREAKRAAQQRQLQNAGVNPAAGFNAGDYSMQIQGYKPQGLPLPSAQGAMPQGPQAQAPQATPSQYQFNAGDYRIELPSYRPQGFAEKVMNFPQMQQASPQGQQSNQQDTLDTLRSYWGWQDSAPRQINREYSPWDALGEIARAYARSRMGGE